MRRTETSRSEAVSCFSRLLRRHGITCGASTVRCQSRRTIAGVCSTCASLSNSTPGCLKTVSAAPIRTRSDCFGLKFAHPVPDDRSGFFDPPVQPAAPPRSARCMTAARAAAWPAAVRWICSLSATAAPAKQQRGRERAEERRSLPRADSPHSPPPSFIACLDGIGRSGRALEHPQAGHPHDSLGSRPK